MALGSRVPEIVPENSDEVRPSALRGTGSKSQTKDTRRVRWFKQADQWFTRWISIAGALHEGFWLGVLRADDLDAITAGHYGQSQEYASAEHNQRGLFDWERVVVEQYFQPGSRILVAAAGNNASDRPFWPAALKHVIAVGALDTTDPKRVRRACFSDFGPWVDVWAPGVGLVSTYVDGRWVTSDQDVTFQGWASWMGTSFAAPLVAAEIARRAGGGSARNAAMETLADLPNEPGFGLVCNPSANLVIT